MRILWRQVALIGRSSPSAHRRTYMDVHTRPSHSRMFKRGENAPIHSPPSTTQTETSDFALYQTLLTRAAMACGMVYVFTEYIGDITMCEGPSMTPTIRSSGEIVFIDKYTIRWFGLHDGYIGQDRAKRARERQEEYEKSHPDEWHVPSLKTVDDLTPSGGWRPLFQQLTTPLSVGDVVVIHHPSRKGTVCKRVLGLPGDQVLYTRLKVVPDGHLWLEGDNPSNSSDSRQYGSVPASLLVGRVLFRVWPVRGHALLERSARPRETDVSSSGSIVLPAGYDGQRVTKIIQAASLDE